MTRPTEADALAAVRTMLEYIGEDPEREGLVDTPKRVVKSWKHLFGGYDKKPEGILQTAFASDSYNQMVCLGPIEYWSTCEHHILPFYGHVYVAYLPDKNGKVVGVSKLARAVEVYARRLQIQERMTDQIAEVVENTAGALGVGVLVRGRHLCMVARGVEKREAWMTTTALRGRFLEDPRTRGEFMAFAGREG